MSVCVCTKSCNVLQEGFSFSCLCIQKKALSFFFFVPFLFSHVELRNLLMGNVHGIFNGFENRKNNENEDGIIY